MEADEHETFVCLGALYKDETSDKVNRWRAASTDEA